MLGWVIKWILISFSIIILLHHLYLFFINTLTIPKVKDLINKPIEQYNEINSSGEDTINFNDEPNKLNENENENEKENEMQNELKSFLNNIKKEEIMTADVLNSSNYSTY
ncbi:hypothetical protein N9O88_00455 [bacterium]|nr:hypothetical protein [bacterium]